VEEGWTLAGPDDAQPLSLPPVSPILELGAYEALWLENGATFKRIADRFRARPGAIPSDFVPREFALATAHKVLKQFAKAGIEQFGLRVHGIEEYIDRLRDASDPIELIYYRGWWDLASSPKSVAVVGTRNISEEGVRRTRKLVKLLVDNDYTIVSGLARGVDTVAHETAIAVGGRTIAVIGTPLTEYYPKENRALQDKIANEFLLVSQVPVLRYAEQDYRSNRSFFPERNKTMSALTDATIIVEAGETSGTLIQARAAIEQKRKLFILDSCFLNPALTWPAKFAERGAIRVRILEDILSALGESGARETSED
jgi:DNA processing protein